MAEAIKPIGSDIEGFESLKRAVLYLLSSYPGLEPREIVFEDLQPGSSGLAIGANSGSLILTERVSITDHVRQTCEFPFFVIYRTSATREDKKLQVADFLDTFGRWMTGQTVTVDGINTKLTSYPKLDGGRKITGITIFNSYGIEPTEDGYQDWYLPVTVQYTNEFDKW